MSSLYYSEDADWIKDAYQTLIQEIGSIKKGPDVEDRELMKTV